MTEEEKKIESNNTKIVFTAFLSILAGAAFILTLIAYGINVQKKLDDEQAQRKESERIVSIIAVDYEAQTFSYTIPNGAMTDAQSKQNHLEKYSLKTQNLSNGKDYIIIDNGDKMRAIMEKIGANYAVDDNFFLTGSVIAVVSETGDIDNLEIRGITRDASYNLQINAAVSKAPVSSTDVTTGFVSFVKIANIQPEEVEVTFTEK